MRSVAITQGKARLESARAALDRARNAQSYPAFAQAWTEFLTACGGIYTKLEQGAKGCRKSEGWFGRKKHDRSTDPLLRYLHHARNSDEHGIEPVIRAGKRVSLSFKNLNVPIKSQRFVEEDRKVFLEVEFAEDVGPGVTMSLSSAGVGILVTVRDTRFGDEFPPPDTHLGKPIKGRDAIAVGDLSVAYFERLLADATELPQRP